MEINTTPSSSDAWLDKLSSGGYRITSPLRVIVNILAEATRALGPVEIFDLSRREYPGMGLVTVYRTLDKLDELGLVQRVHQADGCHAYLRAANGHEHFLLCACCGRVEYFSGDDLNALIIEVATRSGFEIREHWLQFEGLCPTCR